MISQIAKQCQRWGDLVTVSEESLEKRIIASLAELGLSNYEARAYLSLLRHHPSHGHEISRESGVPGPKIYETLNRLVEKGLVYPVGQDPTKYEPLPPEEFLRVKKNEFRRVTRFLERNLQMFTDPTPRDLLWRLNGYDALMEKARELIDTAKQNLVLSIWDEQSRDLESSLQQAEKRGVSLVTIKFGYESPDIGRVYHHALVKTVYERHGSEMLLVSDERFGFLMNKVTGKDWAGYWTTNSGVIRLILNYIRHDIYINKVVARFAEMLQETYGSELELLLDITQDLTYKNQ